MATVTKELLTCDMCGSANNVRTRAFGFDGQQYEIDLCPEDGDGLNTVAQRCIPNARKVTSKGQRSNSHGRRPGGTAPSGEARPRRSQPRKAKATPNHAAKATTNQAAKTAPNHAAEATANQAAKAAPKQATKANDKHQQNGARQRSPRAGATSGEARPAHSQPRKSKAAPEQATKANDKQAAKANDKQQENGARQRSPRAGAASGEAKPSRSQPRKSKAAPEQAAKANDKQQENGVYVYGILPADIEIAAEMPGVGEHPGLLEVVRSDGLAALISEVNLSGNLGSPEDRKTHREILDLTAIEVPVFPLRFGTVLAGEGAVADELLGPRHDEFAAVLERLEGRAEFVVKGRYVQQAVLGEALAENNRAAQLRDIIQSKGPDAAREERAELGEILNETIAVKRKEDTRVLLQAMEGICVASAVRKPARGLDAVDVAFLVAVDDESAMEQLIEDLAREWEGRIEVQLLGPMAAYDFVRT